MEELSLEDLTKKEILDISKKKLEVPIILALVGGVIGFMLPKKGKDRIFPTITVSLIGYETGKLIGDAYQLKKIHDIESKAHNRDNIGV